MDTAENSRDGVIDVRRYLIAKDGRRIDITHCFWCGNRDYICSQCAAEANRDTVTVGAQRNGD